MYVKEIKIEIWNFTVKLFEITFFTLNKNINFFQNLMSFLIIYYYSIFNSYISRFKV